MGGKRKNISLKFFMSLPKFKKSVSLRVSGRKKKLEPVHASFSIMLFHLQQHSQLLKGYSQGNGCGLYSHAFSLPKEGSKTESVDSVFAAEH